MVIRERDIDVVRMCLEAARVMNRPWLAYDEGRRSLNPKGMHFFEFKREANAYCREKQRVFTNYLVVPVSRLIDIIQTIRGLQQKDKLMPIDIHINSMALSSPQQNQGKAMLHENSNKVNDEHVISDGLLEEANSAFLKHEYWIAFNTASYFLDSGDMYFFKTADEAHEFSDNNISESDNYKVIHVYSVDELLRHIPYGYKLEKQLTDPDANGLYNRDGNAFTDELIGYIEQQQILNNKNVSIMNEKNFEYLKDNLKYLGFGENQHDVLERNLREAKEAFQLTFSVEVNKKPFEAVLQFRKSDSSDMYFLNSYHASLERNNGDKIEQTFYLNKGKGVTAKEAYNLLEGRAVFKELTTKANEPYKAWIQLDFETKDKHNNHEVKQYHEKYGYDLKTAVGKYNVVELDGGEKEKALLQSLQKGNIQSVTIEKNGEGHKMFMEANPKYKTVTLFDSHMKRVQKEELGQYQPTQHLNAKEVKQSNTPEEQQTKEKTKQEKRTGKNAKDDDDVESLLPKKRTRQKKGLGLS